jgi:hypothetical protein
VVAEVIPDEKLLGWLVFLKHQWTNGYTCALPNVVIDEFTRRGWLDADAKAQWSGDYHSSLTDLGNMRADLAAPDWGINPIPEPA